MIFPGKTGGRPVPRPLFRPSSGGSPSRLLLENLDLIPGDLNWARPDEVRFAAGVKGQEQIFRVDLASRKFSHVTSGERAVHGFDLNVKAGIMAYLANDFRHMDD